MPLLEHLHSASSWSTASISEATLYFLPDEWPLLSAILKILLKKQRSRDKRALASVASSAPGSLSAPAPPPRLSSHGRILRITQFTPPKASNQWAAKPYWSESECQRRKGKGLNKNRKWSSTPVWLKRGKSLHVQGHGFFNKTPQPPCECRSCWNAKVKGQKWGTLSIKQQNLSGDAVISRQQAG